MIAIPPLTTWYWQLTGRIRSFGEAAIYDIDQEEASATQVASLATAHTMVGYFSAGTWENWRSDAGQFPPEVLGRSLPDWTGEKYLDIRSPVVRDLMAKRMDAAKAKGFVALEPDNVDSFENKSDFPLSKADAIDYLKWLAFAAHERDMAIALKNTPEVVPDVVGDFDFCICEEAFRYNEAGSYSPFVGQNKAVLAAEYGAYSAAKCRSAHNLKFSLAFFNLALNGKRYQPC